MTYKGPPDNGLKFGPARITPMKNAGIRGYAAR
jgi:hypothetical protein